MARYRRPQVLSQRHDPTEPHVVHENNNCTAVAAAMALDYHTGGAKKHRGGEMRHVLPNPNTGRYPGVQLALADAADAWRHYGETLAVVEGNAPASTWDNIVARHNEGRGLILQGDSGDLDGSCSESQDVGHAIFVHPDTDATRPGKWLVGDPWCLDIGTNGLGKWRWVSTGAIKRYAGKMGFGHGYTRRRSRIA